MWNRIKIRLEKLGDERQRKWEIRADRNIISGKMKQKTRQKRTSAGRDEQRWKEKWMERETSLPEAVQILLLSLIPDVEQVFFWG